MLQSKPITTLPHSRKIYHMQQLFTFRPNSSNYELFLLFQFNKKAFLITIDKHKTKKQMVQLCYEFSCPKQCGLPTCGYFYEDPFNFSTQLSVMYLGTSKGYITKFKIKPCNQGKLQAYTQQKSARPQILSCSSNSDGSILTLLNLCNEFLILNSEKLQNLFILSFPIDITLSTNILDTHSKEIFMCTAFNNQKPLYFFPLTQLLHKQLQTKKDIFLKYFRKTTRHYQHEQETDMQIVSIAQMQFKEGFVGSRVICGSFSKVTTKYFVSVYKTDQNEEEKVYVCELVYRFELEDMQWPSFLHLSLYENSLVNIHSNKFFIILDHQQRKKKAQLTIKKYQYPWCFVVDENNDKFIFFMIRGYHTYNSSTTQNQKKQREKSSQGMVQELIKNEFVDSLSGREKFWNIFAYSD